MPFYFCLLEPFRVSRGKAVVNERGAGELGRTEVVSEEPPALRPDRCTEVGRMEGPGRDRGGRGSRLLLGGSGQGRGVLRRLGSEDSLRGQGPDARSAPP